VCLFDSARGTSSSPFQTPASCAGAIAGVLFAIRKDSVPEQGPRGSRPPDGGEVKVSARLEDDRILVGVTDHGTGIAQGDIGRLFQPIARLETPVQGSAIQGVGLGLVSTPAAGGNARRPHLGGIRVRQRLDFLFHTAAIRWRQSKPWLEVSHQVTNTRVAFEENRRDTG
jgi:hypothetical protein